MTTTLFKETDLEPMDGVDETPDPNPLPISSTQREKDLQLWHEWNKDRSNKRATSNLLSAMAGPIGKEVTRVSGSLPRGVLEGAAKRWAIEAFHRYKPETGVALATHVTNWLPKIRRLNYQHQNMVAMSEENTLQFSKFKNAHLDLFEQLNRDPTDDELANHLEWKPLEVKKYKQMIFNDHYESGSEKGSEAHEFDQDKIAFDHFREHHLNDQERVIYDSLFLDGDNKMSNPQLAAKLNVKVSNLTYMKTQIRKKVVQFKKSLGK